jgi:hypothetical protein
VTDMLSTENAGNLPSDVVQIGSVPIYLSNTSPGYAWVTCLGSVMRIKLHEDLLSGSVKADAVRFWNSNGRGHYECQHDSVVDYNHMYKNSTNFTITTPPKQTLDGFQLRRLVLKPRGVEQ